MFFKGKLSESIEVPKLRGKERVRMLGHCEEMDEKKDERKCRHSGKLFIEKAKCRKLSVKNGRTSGGLGVFGTCKSLSSIHIVASLGSKFLDGS